MNHDDARIGACHDIGDAARMATVDHRDFSDDFARPQQSERPPFLADFHLAIEDEEEIIAGLVVAHHAGARHHGFPLGEAQDFPDFDIAEFAEERQGTQGAESFAVGKILLLERKLLVAESLRQVVRELFPAGVARFEVLLHGPRDNGVEVARHLVAELRGRRRLDVGDLVDHAVVVARKMLAEAAFHPELDQRKLVRLGLLHDIGKAVDHEVQGTHVDIGRRILQKYGADVRIIQAMQSHHDEYPYETIESIIVQTADAISGGRPGARRDTAENYLKRLGDLEAIANSFEGVEKTYALQAGREVRIFVYPEKVSDLEAKKMAQEIALRVEKELKYPGEIKINVIRESRVIEYAR